MTAKELRDHLNTLIENGHGDLDVLLSRDPEGNGFESVEDVEHAPCIDGEPVNDEDIGEGYHIDDVTYNIVIWP